MKTYQDMISDNRLIFVLDLDNTVVNVALSREKPRRKQALEDDGCEEHDIQFEHGGRQYEGQAVFRKDGKKFAKFLGNIKGFSASLAKSGISSNVLKRLKNANVQVLVVVYTAGLTGYANCICKILDPHQNIIGSRIISRASTHVEMRSKEVHHIVRLLYGNIKEEDVPAMRKSLLRRLIIFDDNRNVWEEDAQPNLLQCSPFQVFEEKDEKTISKAFFGNAMEEPLSELFKMCEAFPNKRKDEQMQAYMCAVTELYVQYAEQKEKNIQELIGNLRKAIFRGKTFQLCRFPRFPGDNVKLHAEELIENAGGTILKSAQIEGHTILTPQVEPLDRYFVLAAYPIDRHGNASNSFQLARGYFKNERIVHANYILECFVHLKFLSPEPWVVTISETNRNIPAAGVQLAQKHSSDSISVLTNDSATNIQEQQDNSEEPKLKKIFPHHRDRGQDTENSTPQSITWPLEKPAIHDQEQRRDKAKPSFPSDVNETRSRSRDRSSDTFQRDNKLPTNRFPLRKDRSRSLSRDGGVDHDSNFDSQSSDHSQSRPSSSDDDSRDSHRRSRSRLTRPRKDSGRSGKIPDRIEKSKPNCSRRDENARTDGSRSLTPDSISTVDPTDFDVESETGSKESRVEKLRKPPRRSRPRKRPRCRNRSRKGKTSTGTHRKPPRHWQELETDGEFGEETSDTKSIGSVITKVTYNSSTTHEMDSSSTMGRSTADEIFGFECFQNEEQSPLVGSEAKEKTEAYPVERPRVNFYPGQAATFPRQENERFPAAAKHFNRIYQQHFVPREIYPYQATPMMLYAATPGTETHANRSPFGHARLGFPRAVPASAVAAGGAGIPSTDLRPVVGMNYVAGRPQSAEELGRTYNLNPNDLRLLQWQADSTERSRME